MPFKSQTDHKNKTRHRTFRDFWLRLEEKRTRQEKLILGPNLCAKAVRLFEFFLVISMVSEHPSGCTPTSGSTSREAEITPMYLDSPKCS